MEFVEVMGIVRRMCNGCSCGTCLFGKVKEGCMFYMQTYPEEVERRLTEWAKENPEPEYPTWVEWLEEMGVLTTSGDHTVLNAKLYKPIEEDTAKKLRLEKKSAKKS